MKIEEMSLKQKLGQMLVTGFPGQQMSDEFRALVKDYALGNVILFKYNQQTEAQLKTLCADLNDFIEQNTGIAPLISSDEEGGVVSRLPEDMAQMPSAMAQASLRDTARVQKAAADTAAQLQSVGINFNLAPVLDINNNASNPVIGVRSYGETAEQVCRYALAVYDGYEQAGMLTAGKHFPGHGDTVTDSHLALPVISKTLQQLQELELLPFKAAIAKGIPSITIAHILFPALEAANVPATMSRAIVTGLLREQLGFGGLIISDCMEMNAIKETVGVAKGTVEAVKAGIDLIFISHTPAEVIGAVEALQQAVQSGEIPMARIDEAVGRILACKARYLHPQAPLAATAKAEMQGFAEQLSWDAILRSRQGEGTGFALGQNPLFVSPLRRQTTMVANAQLADYSFAGAMQAQFGGAQQLFDLDPTQQQVQQILAAAPAHSSVVLGTVNGNIHPAQMALAEALHRAGVPLAVVALRNPFELKLLPGGVFAFALFEYAPKTVQLAMRLFTRER